MTTQELATVLDVLKDFLGGAGAVMAAITWFEDFGRRRLIERLERVSGADKETKALIEETRRELRRWHEGPSKRDLVLQGGGLALIALSFAISVCKALFLG